MLALLTTAALAGGHLPLDRFTEALHATDGVRDLSLSFREHVEVEGGHQRSWNLWVKTDDGAYACALGPTFVCVASDRPRSYDFEPDLSSAGPPPPVLRHWATVASPDDGRGVDAVRPLVVWDDAGSHADAPGLWVVSVGGRGWLAVAHDAGVRMSEGPVVAHGDRVRARALLDATQVFHRPSTLVVMYSWSGGTGSGTGSYQLVAIDRSTGKLLVDWPAGTQAWGAVIDVVDDGPMRRGGDGEEVRLVPAVVGDRLMLTVSHGRTRLGAQAEAQSEVPQSLLDKVGAWAWRDDRLTPALAERGE